MGGLLVEVKKDISIKEIIETMTFNITKCRIRIYVADPNLVEDP